MIDPERQNGPPPPIRSSERLAPAIFQLPVEKMRSGYYSDKYFVRAREVLLHHGRDPVVTMQVFQKQDAFVAGTDEAIADEPARDRLFDVMMRRFDAMASQKKGIAAVVAEMRRGTQIGDTLTWDGKANGRTVPRGVYIYQIKSEDKVFNGTVVVIR